MFFTSEQIQELEEEYSHIDETYEEILYNYTSFAFKNHEAAEYAKHGFVRRIGTLKRCIQNIYNISPPSQLQKPSQNERIDLGINLQSFVFNVFGCLDNIAWIQAKEEQLKNEEDKPLSGKEIGLMCRKSNKIIRCSFSQSFREYLGSQKEWYKNLENFRHALAHRIPLYVPPFALNDEEAEKYEDLETQIRVAIKEHDFSKVQQLDEQKNQLGHFIPCIAHSFGEKSPSILFHPQILFDWNTVVELSNKFYEELTTI